MSETVTERGPCTECGTPHDACTAPDYCCDECLHFPPDWDGYAPTQPDEPTDVREQIARVIAGWYRRESWDEQRAIADAVLALPAVRDALAAQETLRRQFAAILAASPQLVGENGELRGYMVSLPLLSTVGIDEQAVDAAATEALAGDS